VVQAGQALEGLGAKSFGALVLEHLDGLKQGGWVAWVVWLLVLGFYGVSSFGCVEVRCWAATMAAASEDHLVLTASLAFRIKPLLIYLNFWWSLHN
jgi:hypothetical protein